MCTLTEEVEERVEMMRAAVADLETTNLAQGSDIKNLYAEISELKSRSDRVVDALGTLAVGQARIIEHLNNTRSRRLRRWFAAHVYSGELLREGE